MYACKRHFQNSFLSHFPTRTIFRKVRRETILKIYNILVLPTFLYGSENWTLTALQRRRIESGRNEVIETSGRLHPSWPQNKRLRTPWTTDWMHTKQDRWIQTELAFTIAKNATKPNPFEIISLQTTRKEDNWKTEETLARDDDDELKIEEHELECNNLISVSQTPYLAKHKVTLHIGWPPYEFSIFGKVSRENIFNVSDNYIVASPPPNF